MFSHLYNLAVPPNPCCNGWCNEYLSVDTSAVAVARGSSSTWSQGFAKSAPNKGRGKSAENLLAFSILLIICDVFQVQIKKSVLERVSTG